MDAEFWVAVAFVMFIGGAIYFGVHSKLGAALDDRGTRIREELAEAERLRKEAEAVLASFESKRVEAEKEAAEIVDQARLEAEQMAKEAEERMADFVRRRSAQAEAKIATAELQAMAHVRAAAADAATAAAEIVLKDQAHAGLADRLIQASIGDIKRLTN